MEGGWAGQGAGAATAPSIPQPLEDNGMKLHSFGNMDELTGQVAEPVNIRISDAAAEQRSQAGSRAGSAVEEARSRAGSAVDDARSQASAAKSDAVEAAASAGAGAGAPGLMAVESFMTTDGEAVKVGTAPALQTGQSNRLMLPTLAPTKED